MKIKIINHVKLHITIIKQIHDKHKNLIYDFIYEKNLMDYILMCYNDKQIIIEEYYNYLRDSKYEMYREIILFNRILTKHDLNSNLKILE